MLKQRIITAICLLVIFLFNLFYLPVFCFVIFISAVFLIAAWEWSRLSGFMREYQRYLYCGLSLLLGVGLGCYIGLFSDSGLRGTYLHTLFLISAIWWTIAFLCVQGYPSSASVWGNSCVRAIIGLFILIPSWMILIFLYEQDHGMWLILFMVLIVATADICAYFSGKLFGRRKLAKYVSPDKSYEGMLGGLSACTLLSFIVAYITDFDSWLVLLMIVLPTGLASVLGDLLESMMKRHCGMKDSGSMLPGHGGILDRIDGLTAAAPTFTFAIVASGWNLVS